MADRPVLDLLRDVIKPIPRTLEFFRASLIYSHLLGGGSRGAAKSYTVRWGSVWRLLRWANQGLRKVRVGIFSQDYPTLRDRQITKIEQEFPKWLGELKETRADGLGFHLHPEYGSGVILLRNLADPSQFIGAEIAGAAFEELTQLPDPSAFNTIRGSVRWPGLDRLGVDDAYVWAVTNPLGPGLTWVRKWWIERDFEPEMQDIAHEFHFLPSYPTDNPHLSQEYWAYLRSQPKHIQEAWINGNWYIVSGVMFEELQEALHWLPLTQRQTTTKMIALDWGWQHESAAVWVETGTGVGGPPRSHAYREYHTNHTIASVFAEEVCRLSEGDGIKRVVIDSATVGGGDPTAPFAQMVPVFHRSGMTLEPVLKGPKSREHGWQTLHTYFYPRRGTGPLLTISRNCKTLWRQLTSLQIDEKNPEDTRKDQQDDVATCLRYWAQSIPEPPKPTPEEIWANEPMKELMERDPRMRQVIADQRGTSKWTPDKVVPEIVKRKPKRHRTPWG